MPAATDEKSPDHVGPFDTIASQYTPRPNTDTRTDDEILAAIADPPPVTSEKNVWAWWDKGVREMPSWCQRNVVGWVRILGDSDWTIRVLDAVETSPSFWKHFIKESNVPKCLVEGTVTGDHAKFLRSDMPRLPCLFEHGGVYMDVGIILLMDLDRLCWDKLANSGSRYEVALFSNDASLNSADSGNFFVAARKGNGVIERWLKVCLEVWKDRNDTRGLSDHPLFYPFTASGNKAEQVGASAGYSLDYFTPVLALDRIRLLVDPSDGFNGPNYFKNRVMFLAYAECASAAMLTENDGEKQLQLFQTRYDMDQESKEYQEALKFCNELLTQSAMIKLYHRRHHEDDPPTLAELWDRPENEDADHEKATFAEYLRESSVQFIHLRKITPVKFPDTGEDVIEAGLLECDEE